MITIKQLSYALAVERTLHFRKAAESCNISQSAFSTALSEMEKQLGFQVFERNNKQVLITPMGRQVLARAKTIKLEIDDLQRLMDAHQRPLNAPLSIGIIPTICPYLLPIVLPKLKISYPQLQVNVYEEQSRVLVDHVKRGELDTAILALPFNVDGLLSFQLWPENFFWVTNIDDIRSTQAQININDMSDLMLLNEGHCLKDHVLSVCHLTHKPSHGLSATSLATLVQLVAGNMGITLVPELAVSQLVDSNPMLVKRPLAEPTPHREIAFVVRPNYPTVSNIELLMKLFHNELDRYLTHQRSSS